MNIESIRKEFPILSRQINGKRLVYLDNAATTQKPKRVIDALVEFYSQHNANVHRGLHTLSTEATQMYENAHEVAGRFINAPGIENIVFTRNATESINLVANAWGRKFLKKDDIVVLTEMEHHSNIVPWQILAKEIGFKIIWIPVKEEGVLDIEEYRAILKAGKNKVKLVAFAHISNSLGTVNPVKEIVSMAHEVGAIALVDGAQSVARLKIDVRDLDVDFFAFSSHKMYGPTGIGVLYGKKDLLSEMDPWLGGGGMINRVTKELFECAELPWKFEAGTPDFADGAVFPEAIQFIEEIGMSEITAHERELMAYALNQLQTVEGVKIIGPVDPEIRMGAVSFVVDGIHPHDLSTLLDEEGVAIRAGYHCAMPIHIKYGVKATARASFGVYNGKDDVDIFISALKNAKRRFI